MTVTAACEQLEAIVVQPDSGTVDTGALIMLFSVAFQQYAKHESLQRVTPAALLHTACRRTGLYSMHNCFHVQDATQG